MKLFPVVGISESFRLEKEIEVAAEMASSSFA
jgi:hypothetical protein